MKAWEVALSKLTVIMFYVLMLGLPFSGWFALAGELTRHAELAQISVYGLFHMPVAPALGLPARAMHGLGSNVAMALIGLHILAALKHQFMDDVDAFGRMRPQ
jgi:cytochrome b561